MTDREEKPDEGRDDHAPERSDSALSPRPGEAIEREVDIEYYRSGGPGGQKKNKTETAVRLRHLPTGIVVTASERRRRKDNLTVAFERLRLRLEVASRKKKVRRPTAPPRAVQKQAIEAKRRRSSLKRSRQKVTPEEDG